MKENIAEFRNVVIDYELRKYSLRAVNGFQCQLNAENYCAGWGIRQW